MSPATVAAPAVSLGTRFRSIQSQVSTIPYDSGNTRSVELPRSFLIKNLRIRLRAAITGGGVIVGTNENPLGLIRRIEIVADGRKVLYSADGPTAYFLSRYYNGKSGELVSGPLAAATSVGSAYFNIHAEAARMVSPIMSYFDPRPYEKVELRVTWGTLSDIYVAPGGSTIAATSGLDVQVVQSTEGAEQIGFNRLVMFDELNFTAAFSNYTVNVPRAGLLAGIGLRVTSSAQPSDAVFQNAAAATSNSVGSISLKSDNNFLHADGLNPTVLQRSNAAEGNIDLAAGSLASGVTGYYYLDVTEDGLVTSLLNTYDMNVLQLVLSSDPLLGAGTYVVKPFYVFYEPVTAA